MGITYFIQKEYPWITTGLTEGGRILFSVSIGCAKCGKLKDLPLNSEILFAQRLKEFIEIHKLCPEKKDDN